MKVKRITNKKRKNAWKVWIAFLIALITPLIVAITFDLWRVDASELIDPTRVSSISYSIQTELMDEEITVTPEKKGQLKELTAYAEMLFGKGKGKIMVSICQNEQNIFRKDWPNAILSTPYEYSAGWCQINLKDNYGNGRKIHYDKVPGRNMEEKVEWLKNPYNSLFVSHIIYSNAKGFHDWSAYTNGNYLNTLKSL